MADIEGTRRATGKRARVVLARVEAGAGFREKRFSGPFTLGSAPDCDLVVPDPGVDAHHVQVLFDGILWWVRHLGGAGGTWMDGSSVMMAALPEEARLELGKRGPVVSLRLVEAGAMESGRPDPEPALGSPRELTQDEIIRRYMRPAAGEPAGKQTMMFRAAFQTVQKKSSRRYHAVIAAILIVLASAGGVIAYQRQKLHKLQATAERLFYAMKSFELRTGQLEDLAVASADSAQAAAFLDSRTKLKDMESEYDAFVQDLGVYGRVSEGQRYILRVARRFGECEVNIPKEFIAEVERYVERWREGGRFSNALRRAAQNGYGPAIARAFAKANLPPQYVYLALQESNFNDRAIGPPTRYGVAKGMWQFISLTGHRYGLQIGPLYDQAVYDPADERFDWAKATKAAVKYIRELTATEAQASGLLAMASYNWGEGNVRGIIAAMPENPQERNFWRLLARRSVPAETYDYVLSIFSAAVICENPRVFGFEVECPIPPRPRIDERGRDRTR